MQRPFSNILFVVALFIATLPLAQAHLMVAQHGTLNIVKDSVFMALSLPISAFAGIDDDNDGNVSMIEFNNHRTTIVESIKLHIILSDKAGNRLLEGIMLSPVVPRNTQKEAISQLTVMGRFVLDDADRSSNTLKFQLGLYGEQSTEQSIEITATRKSDNQIHVFELTSMDSVTKLFPDKSPVSQ